MHSREAWVTWYGRASKCGAVAFVALCGAAGCLPDFESLSGGIAAGAGGAAGNGGSAGTAGDAGSGGTAGSAGTGGTGGTAGTGGSAGNPAVLPDGGLANLILNPDFEDSIVRWSQVGNCALRIVNQPPAQSGTRSLEVSNRTFEWNGPGYSLLNMLQDGETYDIGLWVRIAEGEVPLQITMKRQCAGDPASGQYLPAGTAIIANTEWQYLSGTLSAQTCGPTELLVFVEVPNSSASDPNALVTFYIDNVTLTQSGL